MEVKDGHLHPAEDEERKRSGPGHPPGGGGDSGAPGGPAGDNHHADRAPHGHRDPTEAGAGGGHQGPALLLRQGRFPLDRGEGVRA